MESELRSGELIGLRYAVEGSLGKSGLGQTYKCRDLFNQEQYVVVKTLRREANDSLIRAIPALIRLRHPGLIRILDFGTLCDGETAFIVEEFVDGKDVFHSTLGRSVRELVRTLVDLCRALQYLHINGIAHRNLKPSNIVLVADSGKTETLKLLDYGLLPSTPGFQNLAGANRLAYMAPEILMGQLPSLRTDLYALGVVAYELFLRRLPFDDDDEGYLVQKHLHGEVDTRQFQRMQGGTALSQILRTLLEKNPDKRPSSPEEVVRLLSVATGLDYASTCATTSETYFSVGPFVGRLKEMALLQNIATEVKTSRHGRSVFVTGEGGSGKTRLMEEFRTWALLSGWRVVEGSCWPAEEKTYLPYRQILSAMDRLDPVGTVAADKCTIFRFDDLTTVSSVAELDPTSDAAARQFRDRLTREMLRRLSGRPTILLFHDFHYADEATVAILDYLLSDIASESLMVCVSLRTTGDLAEPIRRVVDRRVRLQHSNRIELAPLTEGDVENWVTGLTGSQTLGLRLGKWLHRGGGGNAFFVEEIMKHLIDRTILHRVSGNWFLDSAAMDRMEVPASVALLIGKRLKLLSDLAAEICRWIAVFRCDVSQELLCCASNVCLDAMDKAIAELIERRLVERCSDSGEVHFQFCHTLVGDVVRELIVPRKRRNMHLRIAEVIEDASEPGSHIQELAFHYTECGSGLKAVHYALRAAAIYKAEFSSEPALRMCEFVLRHGDGMSHDEISEVAIMAAELCCALGVSKRARRILAGQLIPPSSGRRGMRGRLQLSLARCYQFSGQLSKSKSIAQRGLRTLSRQHCDAAVDLIRPALLAQIAFCLMAESRPRSGLRLARKALKDLGDAADGTLVGHLHTLIAGLCCIACEFEEGRQAALKAIEILEPLNAIDLLPIAYSHLGINLAGLGRLADGVETHRKAVNLSRKSRSALLKCQAMCNLAECYHRSGQIAAAYTQCREMLKIADEVDNTQIQYAGDVCLLGIEIADGEYAGATKTLDRIRKMDCRRLPIYARAQALYYAASLEVRLGEYRAAEVDLDELESFVGKETPIYEASLGLMLRLWISHRRGEHEFAVRQMIVLRRLLRRRHWLFQLALLDLQLSKIYFDSDDVEKAGRSARSAVRLAKRIPAVQIQAEAQLVLARALLASDGAGSGSSESVESIKQTERRCKEVKEMLEAAGAGNHTWQVCCELARVAMVQHSQAEASLHCEEALGGIRSYEYKLGPLHKKLDECRFARNQCERMMEQCRPLPGRLCADPGLMEEIQLRMLLRFSAIMNSITPLNELVKTVVNLLEEMHKRSQVMLFMVGDTEGQLRLVRGNCDAAEEDAATVGIVNYVYRTSSPFVTGDGFMDQRLGSVIDEKVCGTIFCGPVRTSDGIVGVIYIANRERTGPIEVGNINAFETFCNLAGIAIGNAIRNRNLAEEKERLELRVERAENSQNNIIGRSEVMQALKRRIAVVGSSPLDVLIMGESGTGKELVAKALHKVGRRSGMPLIALDCGALTDNLIEGELFGYRKGSFTGATETKAGLIESANGGVLFLDEVSNLPLRLQGKLLRALQEREIRRLGEIVPRRVDIQIIAATNKELRYEVQKGRFRKDLFYRINSVEIRVPPLREHREDVAELVEHFMKELTVAENGRAKCFGREALGVLKAYGYPGNVRELKNIVQSAYYCALSSTITLQDLPCEFREVEAMELDDNSAASIIELLRNRKGNFEELVKTPFIRHEFGVSVLREIIRAFLRDAKGRYRLAFRAMQVPERDYSVTIQFLKRHRGYLDFRLFRW